MAHRFARGAMLLAKALLLPAAFLPQSSSTPDAPKAKHAPPPAYGPHLAGKQVTLPLVVIKGYPFVVGAINRKTGKLLFDAGEPAAFAINSHAVTIPCRIKTGTGYFGSGQTFEVMNFPVVDELALPNGLRYTGITNIRGNPGLPIQQHIAPDFIGWIGVEFYAGYVLKLDYAKPAATFYRDDALGSGEQAAVAGEHVIQTIRFDNHGLRNLLNFRVKANGTEFLALLDTGSHTAAWLTNEQAASMRQAGSLQDDKDGSMTLSGLEIDGKPVAPMAIEVSHGRPPMTKLLPVTADPVMTLDYEFLNRYKTVWDYDNGTLTLLEP